MSIGRSRSPLTTSPLVLAALFAALVSTSACDSGGSATPDDGGVSDIASPGDGDVPGDGGGADTTPAADAWQHPSPYLSKDGWRWETPLPFGKDLHGVWGASESDIFAVGAEGFIAHYNGTSWSAMDSPTTALLRAVWGSSSSEVYAVGDGGTVLRYDGAAWTKVSVPSTMDLYGVWVGGGTVVAVGGSATTPLALRYDGTSWQEESLPPSVKFVRLTAVWGSAKDDVHVVTTEPPSGQASFLRFDGKAWSITGSVGKDMNAIWGFAKDSVYAAGAWDAVYRYDGTSWTKAKTGGTPNHRRAIYGSSPTDLWLDAYAHFNGSKWSSTTLLHPPFKARVNAGWAAPSGFCVVVAEGGSIATHPAGKPAGSWVDSNKGPTLRGVTGLGDGAVIVGDEGTILRDDGRTQTPMSSPVSTSLYGVWSASASEAYAVGAKGVVLRYDGQSWREEQSGTTAALQGVWGAPSGVVFAAGHQTLRQRQGGTWTAVSLPAAVSKTSFRAVWGSGDDDIYVAGSSRTIAHFDGTDWKVVELGNLVPSSTVFHGIWGSGKNDVYVVGDLGIADLYVLHFDGQSWKREQESTYGQTEGICGTPSRLFAAGYSATGAPVILSKPVGSSSWTADALKVPFDARLRAIWSDGKTQVIAVGETGAVLRKTLP